MERKEPALISLLARLFIKPDPAREEPETRRAYGVLCGIVGICLNVLLFAGKFLAGTLSGSIAITADAFNNLSDAVMAMDPDRVPARNFPANSSTFRQMPTTPQRTP